MPKKKIISLYKFLLKLGSITGVISFLAGIPYGLFLYFQHEHSARVEQSLGFFKQYNSPPYTTCRQNISKMLANEHNKLMEAATDEKKLEIAMLAIIERSQLDQDLELIMDFFDGLAVCVGDNLCDGPTAQRLFASRANEFFKTFYQYIQFRRRTTAPKDYAAGVETFALIKRE